MGLEKCTIKKFIDCNVLLGEKSHYKKKKKKNNQKKPHPKIKQMHYRLNKTKE